jgi:hypothetical protein
MEIGSGVLSSGLTGTNGRAVRCRGPDGTRDDASHPTNPAYENARRSISWDSYVRNDT